MRRNFFKFGLEVLLLGLAITSAGFNLFSESPRTFAVSSNRFVSYLVEHPALNSLIVNKIKMESIRVAADLDHLVSLAYAATVEPMLVSGGDTASVQKPAGTESSNLLLSFDNVLEKPNYATQDAVKKRDIEEYTVKSGDSISKIANNFGVSVQTVLYENKLGETDSIRPGQVLKILPTTGIHHTVAAGETIEGIAKKYQVDVESILEFNQIEVPEDIEPGDTLIIPNAKVQIPESRKSQIADYSRVDVKRANVPDNFTGTSGDLEWPVPMYNITQYFSSKHKALDISNGERPQFWASGDGIVELSGWQAGYGRTIVINHGNGVKTRYGHASELYVSAGDNVTKGQVIGRVGNTGRVYGRTGNHLHFEVIKNGTKVNPLTVVSK